MEAGSTGCSSKRSLASASHAQARVRMAVMHSRAALVMQSCLACLSDMLQAKAQGVPVDLDLAVAALGCQLGLDNGPAAGPAWV